MYEKPKTKPLELGKTYKTQAGDTVWCVELSHECARFSDGDLIHALDYKGWPRAHTRGWRYNRESDRGRCTASAFDMSDPRNVIPELEIEAELFATGCSARALFLLQHTTVMV